MQNQPNGLFGSKHACQAANAIKTEDSDTIYPMHMVWPTGELRCAPTAASAPTAMTVIAHGISAIHLEVPLNFTRSMSHNEHIDVRTDEIPTRKGTEMQHDLLPPSSHMLRVPVSFTIPVLRELL